MSKNAQAECKVKTCFQTLLRRRRFSRRNLKDRFSEQRPKIYFQALSSAKGFRAKLKERASRMQSENLFSDFAEAPPFFEQSSKTAQAECKVKTCFHTLLRRTERQDTILPSIHRLGINFVTEPLDNRLYSSSFRSFFLATISLFCDRITILGCKATQIFRYHQAFPTIFQKYFDLYG